MSKAKVSEGARVVPGQPADRPNYKYQCYQGSSGSASEKREVGHERKFASLRNLVVNAH